MIRFAECFAWCAVQVTLFAMAAAVVYWLVGRQRASRNVHLLAASFGAIAVLTAASVSPWPRWTWTDFAQAHATFADSTLDLAAPANPDVHLLADPTAARPPEDTSKIDLSTPDRLALAPITGTLTLMDRPSDTARPWWLILVWAAWFAVAIGLIRLAVGWALVGRYRRRSTAIQDVALQREFEALRSRLKAPVRVELRESSLLAVPATIGDASDVPFHVW